MRKHLLITAALICVSGNAWAQADSLENRMREQLRSTVSQLRDLQASQATLQAARDSAEKERDALKAKAGKGSVDNGVVLSMKKEIARLREENARLSASASAAKAEATTATAMATRATADAEKTSRQEMERLKTEATRATAALTDAKTAVDACTTKNQNLIKISNDILESSQHIGIGSILWRKEKLLGLRRVQLENAAQATGDKIYANTFNPQTDRAVAQ